MRRLLALGMLVVVLVGEREGEARRASISRTMERQAAAEPRQHHRTARIGAQVSEFSAFGIVAALETAVAILGKRRRSAGALFDPCCVGLNMR